MLADMGYLTYRMGVQMREIKVQAWLKEDQRSILTVLANSKSGERASKTKHFSFSVGNIDHLS